MTYIPDSTPSYQDVRAAYFSRRFRATGIEQACKLLQESYQSFEAAERERQAEFDRREGPLRKLIAEAPESPSAEQLDLLQGWKRCVENYTLILLELANNVLRAGDVFEAASFITGDIVKDAGAEGLSFKIPFDLEPLRGALQKLRSRYGICGPGGVITREMFDRKS